METTVKSFESWSNNRLQTLPVSVLKDSVLGVDGGNYLKKLLETHPTREPLVPALGGFPFSLRANVENDLEHWKQAGIKPLFIFSGIKVARNDKPFSVPDESPKIRSNAWQMYDNGHASQAVETFGDSGMRLHLRRMSPRRVYFLFYIDLMCYPILLSEDCSERIGFALHTDFLP
jgi:hypothetical protein